MTAPYEPVSPLENEQQLRWCITALTKAQQELARFRDDEVVAVRDFKAARRAALLSADCPKVSRDGHTAAERDAWAEQRGSVEEFAAAVATAAREAAQDHLRVVRDQASVIQSLARSVATAYSMAGVS